ncbi:MAG: hypothetical protein B7Z80_03060 [Rhodospirillales bacterium 20-64-7]|nr:MAG: hypothetical protein B7Z80_03060 [Rhodospirillales bacterium 20-64-7]
MSDATVAGPPTISTTIRVLLAVAAPRTRMHMRRLLAGTPGIDVVGHAQSAAQVIVLLQRGGINFVIADASDDPLLATEISTAARDCGSGLIVLAEADRPAPPGLAARAQIIPRPADLAGVLPQSPFQRAVLSALSQRATVGAHRPPVNNAVRPRRLLTGVPDVIAIGSSTGGPQALPLVLGPLHTRVRQPIVVTQHMPPAFTQLLAEHLQRSTSFPTVQASDGMPLMPGRIHIAPGGRHLLFARKGDSIVCVLDDGPPENFCKPAVDPMLRSIAELFGAKAVAVILTGMGHDGLAGCRSLVSVGGTVLAQDEATSVVWGMPGAVAQAGICDAVLPVNHLAEKIVAIAGGRP